MKNWKQKREEAQRIWDGMKALSPELCEKVEISVKRRMKVIKQIYNRRLN